MTTNLPVKTRSNPLARSGGSGPYDPVQQLHDHVAKLNNYRWVVASGKLYYIGSRQRADGTTEHYVDRHI